MTFHSVDLAIGAVLIVALWCIGVVFVGDPALEQQHIAPAAYVVGCPVVAVVTVVAPTDAGASASTWRTPDPSAGPVTTATCETP